MYFFNLSSRHSEHGVKQDLILGRAVIHLPAGQTVEARRSRVAGRDDALRARSDSGGGGPASSELPVEDPLGAAEVEVKADAVLVGGGAVDGGPRMSQVLSGGSFRYKYRVSYEKLVSTLHPPCNT